MRHCADICIEYHLDRVKGCSDCYLHRLLSAKMAPIFMMSALFLLAALVVTVAAEDACDVCGCYTRKNQLIVDCAGLGLETIPDNIPTDVHRLLLQGNELPDLGTTTSLGSTVLSGLKVLFVMGNPIASVTAAFFDKCPRVHTLMLHHTELATLPAGVFNGMTRMKWLWLNNNEITALPVDSFKDLIQVREIYLFNNSITTVPGGVFRDQAIIKHLYLHNNNIPKSEIDCCQFCGLPEPVDVKWGHFAQDETLRCGYDGAISCTFNGVAQSCYPVANKGQTFIFSAASQRWAFLGVGAVLGMVALNSLLVLV